MSMSIDIEVRRGNRLDQFTGVVVLSIAYVGIILLIGWLRHF
jgi:hypothetical protein